MRHPEVVVTRKRQCEEAEAEARKYKRRSELLLKQVDTLQNALYEVTAQLMEYQDRDEAADCQAAERAASPVHPGTMIGRS